MRIGSNIAIRLQLAGVIAACVAAASVQAGTTLTTLFSFNEDDGFQPATLVQTADGSLYGTTLYGGFPLSGGGHGTVFKLNSDGTFTNLVNRALRNPTWMFQAADGNFYGTEGDGHGNGGLFKMTPDGVVADFGPVWSQPSSNGWGPAYLLQDSTGNFYGIAGYGGLRDEGGTVFEIDTNGLFSTLARFDYLVNGARPIQLLLAHDGNFYGVAWVGGIYSQGTLFKMTPDGTLTALLSFTGANGYYPACLLEGADGDLYGTTTASSLGGGTVFRATKEGSLVWSFVVNGINGSTPCFLMQAGDGFLYGTTTSVGGNGNGTIFRITTNGDFSTLFAFTGTNGSSPFFLLESPDNCFYGTSFYGGMQNCGTVFRLSIPRAPVIQRPVPSGDSLQLTWTSVAGQTYQLQYTSDLNSTNWTDLGSPVLATNGTMSASDNVGTDPRRFYRVVLLP